MLDLFLGSVILLVSLLIFILTLRMAAALAILALAAGIIWILFSGGISIERNREVKRDGSVRYTFDIRTRK